ncbi:hypothetical protein SSX86_024806 [Deinandra increscens subsp. villosa]|uniref:M-phase phosphoprotein 6 n=1 Tax=Deinandra increscens subsp. villosa TaxID=3103831 RepID=A0AAP0CGJ0_9ASTR
MAKRELSSTLRNLKFMQRGANNKEEKTKKEEEVIPDGNFRSFITTKKCMVIMEGDPSPGAIRGRMSFQSFNPSIDKLNEVASNLRQSDDDANHATCSGDQGGKPSDRENEEPVSLNSNKFNGDLKRKQVDATAEVQVHNKSPNVIEGNPSSSSNNSRKKSHKRGKLDFNVLRSPKSQNRMG